jgi:HK97 family phage major capsid protein
MTAANIARTGRWRWVMGYRTLGYLTTLRDGLGNAIYPTVEANGTWKGIPILVSNQVPENGGATTDEGTLGLVDFSHVVFAEEEGMVMKASTEASIDDGGTIVYLWQQNMSAVLAEMSHDVGLDNVKAVAKTTVRWGA